MAKNSPINLLECDQSEDAILSVIEAVRTKHSTDPVTAANLARILAMSGDTLSFCTDLVADVASTGGPSSLSTLITPLFLRAMGAIVPKLGVPGRPAGSIDCLAQIPGYKTVLTKQEVMSILDTVGYANFLAAGDFAPLDGNMFRLRQKTGTQTIPGLVVASLLAKKVAVGIKYVGLDVRVALHGNFGTDWESASRNSILFIEAARLLGIKAQPILTDARYLYQPYFGRKESLIALHDYFENVASFWLTNHINLCKTLAMTTVTERCREELSDVNCQDLREFFYQNLIVQGSDPTRFETLAKETKLSHKIELVSTRHGYANYPLEKLRKVIVAWQKKFITKTIPFPDPVGLIFLQEQGKWIEKGSILATLRAPDTIIDKVLRELHPLICNPANSPECLGMEVIYE